MWIQTLIAALTIPALFLVAQHSFYRRRWGFLLGISAQPFWLYATFSPDTYGMFVVSVFTTGTWFLGVWNHWLHPQPQKGDVP